MSYKFEEGKDNIIDAVVEKLESKVGGKQGIFCAEFARQFYGTVALEDLSHWSIDDLYGAIINFWSLIQHRAPNETKIRVYNPDLEQHGWQTTHTVVEIITEDMPFLVASLRMAIYRMDLVSHLIIHMGGLRLKRNKDNEVTAILPKSLSYEKDHKEGQSMEAAIFIELDRQTDPHILKNLYESFESVLDDNRAVVKDWPLMREKVRELIVELDNLPANIDPQEIEETKAFLKWIEDHHFTFLGIRDYELLEKGHETILQPLPQTGLGVLRPNLSKPNARSISAMTPEARELTLSSRIMVMSKTNTEASVHRRAYTDYIGVKRFNQKGQVIGERRIIGLYTSAAYNTNPKHIPFLRHKVALVMKNSHLNPKGHAGKVLLNILETLPRDDLIQASEDELLEMAMGIYYMQERRRIRMFARVDVYRRFISCFVFVPKDRFNTELREAMEAILSDSFHSKDISFSTWFSESVLARIHFIIRIDPKDEVQWNFKDIEKKLIEAGRSWVDDLQDLLVEAFGEEKGNRFYQRYKTAFPVSYTTHFSPRTAVNDIKHMEALSSKHPLVMNFYKPLEESPEGFRLKIYQHDHTIPLSDVLPIIEKLGMRAISERPFVLSFEDKKITWVNEFFLEYTQGAAFNVEEIRELFQNAFISIWFNKAENDGFNQLVLSAGLNWREVAIIRAYAKYFKQIRFVFSQEYIEAALNNNALITRQLIQLFKLRFNPAMKGKKKENQAQLQEQLIEEIYAALEEVSNLDEDKIIRQYIHAITSTLRTNYYQSDENGKAKTYISLKLDSKAIPGIPKPVPLFEIFVYSPRVEGVHLRGGKVARGGIRWSDRREDFRTEILGLMKAQQVKNAVIVPSGAKGGFVPKQLAATASREEIMAEAIDCYRIFIRGLLDITDNYKNKEVIKPRQVLCFDENDPYLVVAADKGTATFSDLANEISFEYDFWLGDAFASGGSVGYDHKKMGITARGAWESVKRHFYELGKDICKEDFTVVGIGDMAGDVFGNGMLLSPHIQLVAAFNHMHIFIDPYPDTKLSFEERDRLFNLPRSTWADYNRDLISKGGGVFLRSAKTIPVSPEMAERFELTVKNIEPSELIRLILMAKVDLLWSAGIGTFVKASFESSTEVGDRGNDFIRIDGNQLQCKVVGEGGNLGLTQLARVEYALNGGRVYTDFIDNSAGVNCSDKEVNIKILLNDIVAAGDLTEKQRNKLLYEMTDEVAQLVIQDNIAQTGAISVTAAHIERFLELHSRYIKELERLGKLDRSLEFLPEEKVLMERKLLGKGLTDPDIAVLLCYSKTILKDQILQSNVPEDPFFDEILIETFPLPLQSRFSSQMQSHPLRREIIATKLSNIIINEMGFTFIYRMQDETGAPVSAIVRAYMITRSILDLKSIWKAIDGLGWLVNAEMRNDFLMIYIRLMRRLTRWFLRNQRICLDVGKSVAFYAPGILELKRALPDIYAEESRAQYFTTMENYLQLGIPRPLAHELTISRALFACLDIIEVSLELELNITKVAEVYFGIGELLEIMWVRSQVIIHPTENHWETLSREALRDELDWEQRQLTAGILRFCSQINKDFMDAFEEWVNSHEALVQRWKRMLSDLRSSPNLTYTMFFVAIRDLLDLTQTTVQNTTESELAV